MLGYSYAMVAASLALAPVAGPVYVAVALAAGGAFLVAAHQLNGRARRGEPLRPMVLFHGSISYLTVVFVAAAAGQWLR